MASSKKGLQSFATEYFGTRRSISGVSRATRRKAADIHTIIVDTNNLATGTLRFSHSVVANGSDARLRQAAAKALAGHDTAESRTIMQALDASAAKIEPIAAPNDIVLGSVWHHGEGFEAVWIGSLASITHYADITENEREKLHMLGAKLAHEGTIAYAVASSKSASQPHRYRDVRATYLGLLVFRPTLYPGTEQTVADIRAHDIQIVYASQNPEHVAQSFAHLSCITTGPAVAYRYRRGHPLPLDRLLYAHLPAAQRQQIIHHYGTDALVVRGSLVAFWQQLKMLRK